MKRVNLRNVPTGYYGKLADAWLKHDEQLQHLYPLRDTEISAIKEQYKQFNAEKRNLLADTILSQYSGLEIQPAVGSAIEKLRLPNTFTVTTGQQIHMFLGPVFFIYKITSAIRHARRLQELYPEDNYIPVFWMATEDHDIAEINTIHVFGKKYTWSAEEGGPTGRLSTEGLALFCDTWIEMGEKENLPAELQDIFQAFKKAYTQFNTLSDATRFIIDHLFGQYGLLIIDADSEPLKHSLSQLAKHDILTDSVYNSLQSTAVFLKQQGFGNQVNPRRTHFFYLLNGKRCRVDKGEDGFKLSPSNTVFSNENMADLLGNQPANFSPNALLRPLYQQLILPNVVYVCGPSELHYWHQLYSLFEKENIAAPSLLLRDSYLFLDTKVRDFILLHSLDEEILWQGHEQASQLLEKQILGKNRISEEMDVLKNQSEKVLEMFFAVKFRNIKELRGKYTEWLKELEKAQKIVLSEIKNQPAFEPVFNRMSKITDVYFNKKEPQERAVSWVEFLLKYKTNPIRFLLENQDLHHVFGTVYV